ncbi:MAG: triose-phosphate isomerase [Clostridiaceae bacterium]|nr:triose-phosphate isomerase [Clostridiaceae bacterium]
MRRKIIAGNWKMNKLPNEAMEFINSLQERIKDIQCEVVLCVPYTDLFYSLLTAQGTSINIGAQNMHWEESGSYTGEISANMLKCINVNYVIIGHSERRKYFAETDELINKKLITAISHEITPILCIGENLKERALGIQEEIVLKQITIALQGLSKEQVKNVIIAYEPIWAIGTGKVATKEDVNNMLKGIRKQISIMYDENVAQNITLLYGGSVNKDNAKELLNIPDMDGALVGGASLDASEFGKLLNQYSIS